jgi:hypothetical protein
VPSDEFDLRKVDQELSVIALRVFTVLAVVTVKDMRFWNVT